MVRQLPYGNICARDGQAATVHHIRMTKMLIGAVRQSRTDVSVMLKLADRLLQIIISQTVVSKVNINVTASRFVVC